MRTALQPGDIVPWRTLPRVGGGPPVRIGANRRRAQVLVVTHTEPCDPCARYLESLADRAESLRAEKAEILAIVGPAWEDRSPSPIPALLADPAVVAAYSPDSLPVVAVVDRFGQLFTRVEAGHEHAFPGDDQIVGCLIDIAIRCPECGVPDVPSPAFLPEAGTRSGGMVLGQ